MVLKAQVLRTDSQPAIYTYNEQVNHARRPERIEPGKNVVLPI